MPTPRQVHIDTTMNNEDHYIKIDGMRLSLDDLVSTFKQQADRRKLKQAQAARAKKYGIAARADGSLTIPAKFARLGAKESDYADPVNFKFPVWLSRSKDSLTPTQLGQVRNAPARFGQFKNNYDAKSRASVQRRIDEALKKFEIGDFAKSDEQEIKIDFEFIEKDGFKRLLYGVALKPDEFDSQGDKLDASEIERIAHQFLTDCRKHDLQHKELLPESKTIPVESYVTLADLMIGGKTIKKGSWVVVSKILDDAIWQQVMSGEIRGYSIKGVGRRKLLSSTF